MADVSRALVGLEATAEQIIAPRLCPRADLLIRQERDKIKDLFNECGFFSLCLKIRGACYRESILLCTTDTSTK